MWWWPCGSAAWGGGWWVGGVMMLAFWALVVVGVVWLVRSLTGTAGRAGTGLGSAPGEGHATPSRALAILEERFARGELSAEEFRRMREELR